MLLDILAITGPIFMLMGLGYGAVASGGFPKEGVRLFGKFVLNFAMPALLFQSLARKPIGEIINADYLAVYALGSLAVFAGGLALALFWRRMPLTGATMLAMGVSCSNSGFIGYPLILQLYGPEGAVPIALTMLVENLLMFPLAIALAETGLQGGESALSALATTLKRMATNPLVLGITAGLAVSLSGLVLPVAIERTIDMLAKAAGAVALFSVGASLHGLGFGKMAGDAAGVAFGKLVLHPLGILGAALFFPGLDPRLKIAAIIIACVPMFSIYPVIGQRYGEESACAARLLVAVVAAFGTISGLLYWLTATGALTR